MRLLPLVTLTILLPSSATAQLVEEVRAGALGHNLCIARCKNAEKEDGPNIEAEIVFASPGFLDILLAPRPYLVGSVNTAGNTSYAGAGLMWNFEFADGWSLEPSFGYAIHDGEVDSPYPQGDPRSEAFAQEHVLLGSRDLFRSAIAINRDFGENWGGQLIYEHLSHGEVLGGGHNQGLDSAGVRVYYRFGG